MGSPARSWETSVYGRLEGPVNAGPERCLRRLLHDIRSIFDQRGIERLFSEVLVAALNDLDDSMWCEWRGPHGDQQPRRLSQGGLAQMLAPFSIRPRTIWPLHRSPDSKSRKGYLRSQFESAWSAYCDASDGTASQSSTVRGLRRV